MKPEVHDAAPHDTDEIPAAQLPTEHRRRFRIPPGLAVVLGAYFVLVFLYVWLAYWRSPDYQAAQHWDEAREVLALKNWGKDATREELEATYRHLLEAARLKPEVKTFHDELEALNWRFEEKKWRLDPALRHNAEAVAMTWMNIQKANEPILVVGVRDRGWAPDQVLAGPAKVALWSPVGALLIIAVWAYLNFSSRRLAADEKEKHLREQEQHLAELEKQRSRGASNR